MKTQLNFDSGVSGKINNIEKYSITASTMTVEKPK
jgi:hypothetical protein